MIQALIAHLLQSTLFAGGALLLNLLLRKNAAQMRHRIWFIASIKFLIPFSLLVGIGELTLRRAATPATQPEWIAAAQQIVQPLATFPEAATRTVVAADAKNYFAVIALALWTAGFAAIAIWWIVRWNRIHVLRKAASEISIPGVRHSAIPVVSATGVLEPGIVGILRPVLLLPEGIEHRLDPEQLDAILLHEFAHVRRHDNLTAAIHMAVQSIFWFHPLIWWLGMRLVEERERACDEEVLRVGVKPDIYAKGILNVCRLYVESPLACVSGVTGSDLKKRIEAIMRNRAVRRVNLIWKIALPALGMAAIALPVTLGVFKVSAPAFHAASVRRTVPNSRTRLDFRITGDRLVSTNWNLSSLIQQAWNVRYYQVLGGPAWLRNDNFNIEATARKDASRDEMLAMLRTLLEDRFQLRVHRETRDGSVYALTLGMGGPKLQPPAKDTDRSRVITLRNTPGNLPGVSYTEVGRNATLAQLTEALSNIVQGPVTDKTGIAGNFDFGYDYRTLNAPQNAGPSIFDSVQSQLGLKLEARNGQVEVLVIDHAEKPSEN